MDQDYKNNKNGGFNSKNRVQFENNYRMHTKEYEVIGQKENRM